MSEHEPDTLSVPPIVLNEINVAVRRARQFDSRPPDMGPSVLEVRVSPPFCRAAQWTPPADCKIADARVLLDAGLMVGIAVYRAPKR